MWPEGVGVRVRVRPTQPQPCSPSVSLQCLLTCRALGASWLQCIIPVKVTVVTRPPKKCCRHRLSKADPGRAEVSSAPGSWPLFSSLLKASLSPLKIVPGPMLAPRVSRWKTKAVWQARPPKRSRSTDLNRGSSSLGWGGKLGSIGIGGSLGTSGWAGHTGEGSPALGQQGPTQGGASDGADHSTHAIPQSQLRGRNTMVQQEKRKQAAGALLTLGCGEGA